MENQVILYQPNETIKVDVRLDGETVWLTQEQMCQLFGRTQSVIARHIANIFKEGELERDSVYAKFAYTASDGKTYQVAFYNLDVIISVGYRVKSVVGTRFRIWATRVLRERLLSSGAVERRMTKLENRMDQLEIEVRRAEPLPEQIYCDGQQFDAYVFFCNLIRKAKHRVFLIDNYVNDAVLTMLDKRGKGVAARIYTGKYSKQFQLDLARHNAQYPNIEVVNHPMVHDRFLIVDDTVWMVGASLKDAGKKKFAVIKTQLNPSGILPILKP